MAFRAAVGFLNQKEGKGNAFRSKRRITVALALHFRKEGRLSALLQRTSRVHPVRHLLAVAVALNPFMVRWAAITLQ